jgi:hypothetical protein
LVVPNTNPCTAAGALTNGAICAETITGIKSELSFDQYLEFLEPQEEREDPLNPGQILPKRGGAICQSTSDWGRMKTALEQACRILAKKCSYELRAFIENMGALAERADKMGVLP